MLNAQTSSRTTVTNGLQEVQLNFLPDSFKPLLVAAQVKSGTLEGLSPLCDLPTTHIDTHFHFDFILKKINTLPSQTCIDNQIVELYW